MDKGSNILSDYFTKAELAAQLRRSIRSIDRWALTGDGPPSVRIGKTTLYRRESVLAWLRSRETAPVRPRHGRGGCAMRSVAKQQGRSQSLQDRAEA
jgi:hypothetical protein